VTTPDAAVVALAGAIAEASGLCRRADLLAFSRKEPSLAQGIFALAEEYVGVVRKADAESLRQAHAPMVEWSAQQDPDNWEPDNDVLIIPRPSEN